MARVSRACSHREGQWIDPIVLQAEKSASDSGLVIMELVFIYEQPLERHA